MVSEARGVKPDTVGTVEGSTVDVIVVVSTTFEVMAEPVMVSVTETK